MQHDDDDHITAISDIFGLLGEPTRLRIVLTCLDKAKNVSEIAQELRLSTSLISHHLRLLRAFRIILAERSGKNIYCRVADEHISTILHNMLDHIREPDGDSSLTQET